MNDKIKIPVLFYVLTSVLLVWNLMGISAFIVQMSIDPSQIEAMSDSERDMYENYPAWALIVFGIAVFGSSIGALALLLRRKFSKKILLVSLLAVLVQMSHNVFVVQSTAVYGPGAIVMPVMVVIISVFLLWYSNFADKKGWLR